MRSADIKYRLQWKWDGEESAIGELLDRGESNGFELLIVADKNFQHQQNLKDRRIAILELWTNHRPSLENHFERIRAAADSVHGTFVTLNEES